MKKKSMLNENKVFGINLLYIASIIPIILFAFYKNGFVVYRHGYMSLWLSLQYLIIPFIIIILSYVFENYYYLIIKKEKDNHSAVNSIVPYVNALCYLVCGPLDYLWLTIPLIIILDIFIKFIDSKFTVNQIALFKCILFGVLSIMGIYSNANFYEIEQEVSNSFKTLLIGTYIGEIGTTSVVLSLFGYFVLLFNKYYKKEIPIIAILSYAIVCVIIYFVRDITFKEILINSLSSGFIFAAVFVASLSTATPVIKSGRIIYAMLFGIASAVLVNTLNFNLGIYIVILVLSLLVPLFNKIKFAVE